MAVLVLLLGTLLATATAPPRNTARASTSNSGLEVKSTDVNLKVTVSTNNGRDVTSTPVNVTLSNLRLPDDTDGRSVIE